MAEGGYNFELCGHRMPDLECPICMNLLKQTKELPCCNCTTCAVCLHTWEEEQLEQRR